MLKQSKSLNSLKALSSPTAKVLRDGQKDEIPSKEVVAGDILYLDAGDYVPADGRLIESHSLQINESSLTGESLAVDKVANTIVKQSLHSETEKTWCTPAALLQMVVEQ